jgi:ankyrin repeat protein
MISITRLIAQTRDLRWKDIQAGFDAKPELLSHRDGRGRNWLHLCCSIDPAKRKRRPSEAVKLAGILLDLGLDLDQEAFREGSWKATPLWFAIARGRNLALARFLLDRGADPNHCLWAAGFNDDVAAIRLLVEHGAEIDPVTENETPFLGAVKWSRFRAAECLLEHGADVDYRDPHGMTALHYMLKKGTDAKHLHTLVAYGARGDIPDAKGATAAQILARKRLPAFRKLARELKGG